MIITNWEFIQGNPNAINCSGIYFMYDNYGTCLYVGMSNDCVGRLLDHADRRFSRNGLSRVGEHIFYNKPDSLHWPVVIAETKDYMDDPRDEDGFTKLFEAKIIYQMATVFNGTHNNDFEKKRKNFERWESYANVRLREPYFLDIK